MDCQYQMLQLQKSFSAQMEPKSLHMDSPVPAVFYFLTTNLFVCGVITQVVKVNILHMQKQKFELAE